MGFGQFSLCTMVEIFHEVLEDGASGYVALSNDPNGLGERLLTLRDILYKVVQMSQSARQRRLTRFTWDNVVNCFFAAYGVAGVPLSAS